MKEKIILKLNRDELIEAIANFLAPKGYETEQVYFEFKHDSWNGSSRTVSGAEVEVNKNNNQKGEIKND